MGLGHLFHLNVGALEMREEKGKIHLERGKVPIKWWRRANHPTQPFEEGLIIPIIQMRKLRSTEAK